MSALARALWVGPLARAWRRLVAVGLAVALLSCGTAPAPHGTSRAELTRASRPPSRINSRTHAVAVEPSPEPTTGPELTLATFNIQVFGPAKTRRPEVMKALASVIRKYDLVAVQEIKDASGRAPRALLALVNEAGAARYSLSLSPRTGQQPDDRDSQEQYAYYFRTDRLREAGAPTLYDDSVHDHFQREPYLSRFELVDAGHSFVVINVHTRPRSAVPELAAMEHVFAWARAHYAAERTFIAVGDFNAGCGYASEEDLRALPIHGDAYDWVVPHSADTSLADPQCPYDRIVIAAPEGQRLVERWGVDQAFHDRLISDHWPVWATLRWTAR